VLADPIRAAGEGGIALSASEQAIVASIPPANLAGMIDGFARSRGLAGMPAAKFAAGAAAAAAAAMLLVSGGLGQAGEQPSAAGGVRADEPPPPPPKQGVPAPTGIRPDEPEEAPAVLWMTDLGAAQEQAARGRRALMAVFLTTPKPPRPRPPVTSRGISADSPRVSVEERSRRLLVSESKDVRVAVRNAGLLAVRVTRPVPPFDLSEKRNLTPEEVDAVKKYTEAKRTYEEALEKHAIADSLPAVVFAAPDGSALRKLVRPTAEADLVAAIRAVPPLLARWMIEHARTEEPQVVTDGIRPDEPVTKGIRPDLPKSK
jgi:hypothetical protein